MQIEDAKLKNSDQRGRNHSRYWSTAYVCQCGLQYQRLWRSRSTKTKHLHHWASIYHLRLCKVLLVEVFYVYVQFLSLKLPEHWVPDPVLESTFTQILFHNTILLELFTICVFPIYTTSTALCFSGKYYTVYFIKFI